MIKTKLAIASILLILAPIANVSAGTLNDDFKTTLQVDSLCRITTPTQDIYIVHDPAQGTGGYGVTGMAVTCNQDLPFTIEVDTLAGGNFTLTDGATAKTLGAKLTISDDSQGYSPVVWGSTVNGEALPMVGTGLEQDFTLDVTYDSGRLPAVGIYNDTKNVIVNF